MSQPISLHDLQEENRNLYSLAESLAARVEQLEEAMGGAIVATPDDLAFANMEVQHEC